MLTEEQKKIIEENKRKALEKRKQKESINGFPSIASPPPKSNVNTFTIPKSPTPKKPLPTTSYSPSFRKRPLESCSTSGFNPNLEVGNSPSTSASKQSTSYSPAFKKKKTEVETDIKQTSVMLNNNPNKQGAENPLKSSSVNSKTDHTDFSPLKDLDSKPKTSFSPAFKKNNIHDVRRLEKPTTSYNPFQKKTSTHQKSTSLDHQTKNVDLSPSKAVISKPTTSYSPSFKKRNQDTMLLSPTSSKATQFNQTLSSPRKIVQDFIPRDIVQHPVSSSLTTCNEMEDKIKRAEMNRLKAVEKLKNKQKSSTTSIQESVPGTNQKELLEPSASSSQETLSQESKNKDIKLSCQL